MRLPQVFSAVCVIFGLVFVLVNAGGLPGPWDVAARVAGLLLLLAAAGGILRSHASSESWSGSAKAYWVAVALEIVAIPVGATLLTRVLDQPDLVVLWVVFVVGAHFVPARSFGIGRYTVLGIVLMLLAVAGAATYLVTDLSCVPSAGAVMAGMALLGFAALPRR